MSSSSNAQWSGVHPSHVGGVLEAGRALRHPRCRMPDANGERNGYGGGGSAHKAGWREAARREEGSGREARQEMGSGQEAGERTLFLMKSKRTWGRN